MTYRADLKAGFFIGANTKKNINQGNTMKKKTLFVSFTAIGLGLAMTVMLTAIPVASQASGEGDDLWTCSESQSGIRTTPSTSYCCVDSGTWCQRYQRRPCPIPSQYDCTHFVEQLSGKTCSSNRLVCETSPP